MTDYAKLTKAQLIEELGRQKLALMSLKQGIDVSLMHELEVRQIELEMQNHELRKAQLQLGEAHDRYAGFHNLAPTGYLTLDQNGCILEINPAAATMLGRDSTRVIGKPFSGHVVPGDSDSFFRHLRQAFGPVGKSVVELKVKGSAGESRDIQLESMIEEGVAGNIPTCRTIMADITERKLAEKALYESEERLRLIGESINEVFWIADVRTGKMITVSQSYERVWQRTCKELYENPRSFFDVIHPEDRERVILHIQTQMCRELPFDNEYRIVWPDGSIRWIFCRGYPVRDQTGMQEVTKYAGVAQDITRQREAEYRAQGMLLQNRLLTKGMYAEKEEARRHLARELHDELGQWLTAIQAEAEAILSNAEIALPSKIIVSAQAISNSATEVHGLIRKIISRLRPSLLDALGLADSLHDLVAQWRGHHPQIHCELALDGDLGGLGEATNITVYRAIQEALTNVAKHAQASRVAVRLCRTSGMGTAADALQLTVEDDGKGMDAGVSHHGLGLLGMRERVIALGGGFTQRSAPGQGMSIDVRLPLGSQFEQEKKNRYLDTPLR